MTVPLVATFLPQYHRDPLNDAWWGSGFTEWDNVRSATPSFNGHIQPKIPVGGYYSLDDKEELERQFDLASAHGINAFSIYHYWSNGVRVLSKPVDMILQDQNIKIRFSLCWANHPWTRTWRNRAGALDTLLEQTYERQSDHFRFLCKAFVDSRYLTVDGRPVFSVYRPADIPNLKHWCDDFRESVYNRLNIEPYLIAVVKNRFDVLSSTDFDACNIFQPSAALFEPADLCAKTKRSLGGRFRTSPMAVRKAMYVVQDLLPDRPKITSYSDFLDKSYRQFEATSESIDRPLMPMICVGFDNTPRYKNRATILDGMTISALRTHCENISEHCARLKQRKIASAPPLIFINSWNEWGEGMFLQADQEFMYSKLKAIETAFNVTSN